ncbi:MAG: FmdB family zinc ribbon protein [Propionibacteriaceae bacterium]
MPTYQYRCTDCGRELEVVQKFSDPSLTACPACQGALRKVFNAVGVVFKGSGFYRTDSREAKKARAVSESKNGETGAGSKDSGSKDGGPKESGGSKESSGSKESGGSKESSGSKQSNGSTDSGSSTSAGSGSSTKSSNGSSSPTAKAAKSP